MEGISVLAGSASNFVAPARGTWTRVRDRTDLVRARAAVGLDFEQTGERRGQALVSLT